LETYHDPHHLFETLMDAALASCGHLAMRFNENIA
jgi:hypothetical protein